MTTTDRFHIDRVSDYGATLGDDSGMPWFSESSDHSRLVQALGLAANLHNPALVKALTRSRTLADSADDLERIANQADMEEPARLSMRRVARILRDYEEPR